MIVMFNLFLLLISLLQLVLVNPLSEVMEKLQRADEERDFTGPDCLYLTVGEAVASLSSVIKGQTSNHV